MGYIATWNVDGTEIRLNLAYPVQLPTRGGGRMKFANRSKIYWYWEYGPEMLEADDGRWACTATTPSKPPRMRYVP